MKKLFAVVLLTALLASVVDLGLGAQPLQATLSHTQDSLAPLPSDAVLLSDVTIDSDMVGHRHIQRWERVIGGVIHVYNDYVRVHEDATTNEVILYEKRWRDIDIDLTALDIKPFEPADAEYIWKKVVMFVDEEDRGSLGDFFEGSVLEGLPLYSFYGVVEYPLVCWEVRYADGSTVVYDLDGNRIGHGNIAAPSSKGYVAHGTDPNPIYPIAWEIAAADAYLWYSQWTDSTTGVYDPDPDTNPISPYVSDPDTLFYYAIGHGSYDWYSALRTDDAGEPYWDDYYTTSPGDHPDAGDAYADMQNRGRMQFALMVHCDSMTQTGQGSFSHAFRKGSLSGTVTVGFEGLGEASTWENLAVFFWQDLMLYYMDEGYRIKDAFDQATIWFDLVAPYARFAGDTMQKVYSGVMGYVGISTPYGAIPLQGAKVEADGTVDYTDQHGYYEILLPPDSYSVTASYPTLEERTYTVRVYSNRLTRRDFILEDSGMPIPLGIPGGGVPEGGAL
jgi:hypothetical protein